MIYVYGVLQKPARAVEIFQRMKNRGIVPDVITYNTLIDVYGRARQLDKSEAIFNHLVSENLADDRTYTEMLNIYAKIPNIEKALDLFQTYKNSERFTKYQSAKTPTPATTLYNILMDMGNKLNQSQFTFAIYNQLRKVCYSLWGWLSY